MMNGTIGFGGFPAPNMPGQYGAPLGYGCPPQYCPPQVFPTQYEPPIC